MNTIASTNFYLRPFSPEKMMKQVAFQINDDGVSPLVDSQITDELKAQIWYSEAELKESRNLASLAVLAVNDACGDFDVTHESEICVKTLLAEQAEGRSAEQLASTSAELSKSSVGTARLYAAVLEKEVQETESVTFEMLSDLVNGILVTPSDDSQEYFDDDSDTDSMGTIDELTNDFVYISECPRSGADEIVREKISPSLTQECDFVFDKLPSMDLPADDDELKSPLLKKKRQGRESSSSMVSESSASVVSVPKTERRVKPRLSNEDDTQNRCNVAHALISLARWEFKGCRLSLMNT
jgi:hypothetical protein